MLSVLGTRSFSPLECGDVAVLKSLLAARSRYQCVSHPYLNTPTCHLTHVDSPLRSNVRAREIRRLQPLSLTVHSTSLTAPDGSGRIEYIKVCHKDIILCFVSHNPLSTTRAGRGDGYDFCSGRDRYPANSEPRYLPLHIPR